MFEEIRRSVKKYAITSLKSFNSDLMKGFDNEFEKAHKDGDLHPNGKWVWVSSAAGGKGDWRKINGRAHQKHQASQGGGSASGSSTQQQSSGDNKKASGAAAPKKETAKPETPKKEDKKSTSSKVPNDTQLADALGRLEVSKGKTQDVDEMLRLVQKKTSYESGEAVFPNGKKDVRVNVIISRDYDREGNFKGIKLKLSNYGAERQKSFSISNSSDIQKHFKKFVQEEFANSGGGSNAPTLIRLTTVLLQK